MHQKFGNTHKLWTKQDSMLKLLKLWIACLPVILSFGLDVPLLVFDSDLPAEWSEDNNSNYETNLDDHEINICFGCWDCVGCPGYYEKLEEEEPEYELEIRKRRLAEDGSSQAEKFYNRRHPGRKGAFKGPLAVDPKVRYFRSNAVNGKICYETVQKFKENEWGKKVSYWAKVPVACD